MDPEEFGDYRLIPPPCEHEAELARLRARVAELEAEQRRAQRRALSFGPNSAHWTAEEAARYILGEA